MEHVPAAHWDAVAAADFFTVEAPRAARPVRSVVFFVKKPKSRRVAIAGMAQQPDETWNLTAAGDGFLNGIQHVILDRDPRYTTAFRRL